MMTSEKIWDFLPFMKVETNKDDVDFLVGNRGVDFKNDATLLMRSHYDHIIDAPLH